ncbi:MFS general substrate transporter [Tuber magnatum]|uniref:MFS general substrate transporter n=1 Tax=Tuber magnatum TaxID=42249 RepID=A0A317ST13_9PEZI|nr:MFS general substrate transporter [Tuber magnatum]
MGLWILEPKKREGDDYVPGTAFIGAGGTVDSTTTVTGELDPNLKYDLTGDVPIVLVPQPSDDPNDPLNWPLWERDLITFILCLVSVSLHLILTRTNPCPEHCSRHLYLLGTVLLIVSSVWAGLASNYKSFLWARILQGVAVCPFETLVNISVGEMYCVHAIGKRMALSNFALFGGSFLTPVIVGKITGELGWQWPFFLVAIFTGALLPLVVLWLPETTYNRPAHHNTTLSDQAHFQYTAVSPRHSFLQRMSVFTGRKTSESPLKLFYRPIVLLLHPAVMWGMLTQGVMIGWTVMIGVVLAAFLGPPLYFTEVEVGYMYTGAFIGSLAGLAITGPLADWSAKYLAKKNKGIYEPEFRLYLVIPQTIAGCLGLYMFGVTASNTTKYGWFWPDFFFGLELMGMTMGAISSALYLVDAYPSIAIETFTCLLLFKNFFSFALTWEAFNWLRDTGTKDLFIYIASVQVAVCSLTLPMYFLGKISRDFMHRHDILKMVGLDTGKSGELENLAVEDLFG